MEPSKSRLFGSFQEEKGRIIRVATDFREKPRLETAFCCDGTVIDLFIANSVPANLKTDNHLRSPYVWQKFYWLRMSRTSQR
jgi:hypothetical protein